MQTIFAQCKPNRVGAVANSSSARGSAPLPYHPDMAKDPSKIEFGKRLRATAAEFGYPNAAAIATLCGAERAAVDTWLNGRALPKWHQAAKLCAAWRVTLDWLFLGKGDGLPHGTYVRLMAALEVAPDDPSAQVVVTEAQPAPASGVPQRGQRAKASAGRA